jgi:peptidoglycan-associated lipoprotein
MTSVAGCKKKQTPPPATPGATEAPTASAGPAQDLSPDDPTDDPSKSQINISDEIKKACGITDSDAYFAFDSANVRPQDQKVLQQLATCFSTGPLKGRVMRLVGHADPRGDEEYNMVLGERRASNVRGFIAQKGLDEKKMTTTSEGEMRATGTDEASWAKDRRVDIVLGD